MYSTLAAVKAELKASQTTDDARLKGYLFQVSRRIDMMFSAKRPLFEPYIEQRRFPIMPMMVNSTENTLAINDYLLALSALTVGDEAVTSAELWQDTYPYPAKALRLTDDSLNWYSFNLNTRKPYTALVTGTWGWQRDYANAWDGLDTLQANINASVTSLTVADADGADSFGLTPRFSYGNLIRIDSEFMLVTDTNTTTNVLTVQRGANGSTAAAHTAGASVDVWQVDELIHRAATRQTAFMQARQGTFQSADNTGLGTFNFPQDLLQEVYAIVQVMNYA